MADDFPWGNDDQQVQDEGESNAPEIEWNLDKEVKELPETTEEPHEPQFENGTVAGLGADKGGDTLNQVAIWGSVGLLGYFLVGPLIGLKKGE